MAHSSKSAHSEVKCEVITLVTATLWHGARWNIVSLSIHPSGRPSISWFDTVLELWASASDLRWEQPLNRCLLIYLVLITKPPSRVCPHLPGASPRVISQAALNKQASLWRPLPMLLLPLAAQMDCAANTLPRRLLLIFFFFFFCNMTLTIEKKHSGEFPPLFIRESLVSLSGATEEPLSIRNRRGPSEAPNWSLVRRTHVALKVGSRQAAG